MKILLVEDDERLSRSLARLLEQDRHNVEVAARRRDRRRHRPRRERHRRRDPRHRPAGHLRASRSRAGSASERRELAILMLTARDTVGDRVDRARLRRRRLRRQAVRLRRARRPAAGARPARRERRPARRSRRLIAGPIALDEADPDGHRPRSPGRPQPARVLAPRVAPPPPRPGPQPRPAPRPGVAVRRRRDPERRRRLRPLPPDEARPRGRPDRDRPRRRVPSEQCLTERPHPGRRPGRRSAPSPPTAG